MMTTTMMTTAVDTASTTTTIISSLTTEEVKIENSSLPNPPEILSDLVIGINEVTKHLEKSINQGNNNGDKNKKLLISTIPKKTNDNRKYYQPLNIIFVCKYDISPSQLYSHLPIMACLDGKV